MTGVVLAVQSPIPCLNPRTPLSSQPHKFQLETGPTGHGCPLGVVCTFSRLDTRLCAGKRNVRRALLPTQGRPELHFSRGLGGNSPSSEPPPPKKKEGKRKKETDVQAVLEPCNAVDCLQWFDQVTKRSLPSTQYPIPAPYVYRPTFPS